MVLIPQPSQDINDPLRWSTWKKHFAFLNVCLFAFMITGYVGGFAPALYRLGIEFDKPMNESINLILWPLLLSGLGVSDLGPQLVLIFVEHILIRCLIELLLGSSC